MPSLLFPITFTLAVSKSISLHCLLWTARFLIWLYDPIIFILQALALQVLFDDLISLAPPIPDPQQGRVHPVFEDVYRTPGAQLPADLNPGAFEAALAANKAYWENCHAAHLSTLKNLQSPRWSDVLWGYYEFSQLRLLRRNKLPFHMLHPAQLTLIDELFEQQQEQIAIREREAIHAGMLRIAERVARARETGDYSALSRLTANSGTHPSFRLYTETNVRMRPSAQRAQVLAAQRFTAWQRHRYVASREYAAWYWQFRVEFNATVAACMRELATEREVRRWQRLLSAWTIFVRETVAPFASPKVQKRAASLAVIAATPLTLTIALSTSVRLFILNARYRAVQKEQGPALHVSAQSTVDGSDEPVGTPTTAGTHGTFETETSSDNTANASQNQNQNQNQNQHEANHHAADASGALGTPPPTPVTPTTLQTSASDIDTETTSEPDTPPVMTSTPDAALDRTKTETPPSPETPHAFRTPDTPETELPDMPQ